jgi:hypothetical protein
MLRGRDVAGPKPRARAHPCRSVFGWKRHRLSLLERDLDLSLRHLRVAQRLRVLELIPQPTARLTLPRPMSQPPFLAHLNTSRIDRTMMTPASTARKDDRPDTTLGSVTHTTGHGRRRPRCRRQPGRSSEPDRRRLGGTRASVVPASPAVGWGAGGLAEGVRGSTLSAGSPSAPGRAVAQGRHLRRTGGSEAAPCTLAGEADMTSSWCEGRWSTSGR